MKYRSIDPALLIEAALRQEVMGQKGVYVGNRLMSSTELRRLAGSPLFPLRPFDGLSYYQSKTDSQS